MKWETIFNCVINYDNQSVLKVSLLLSSASDEEGRDLLHSLDFVFTVIQTCPFQRSTYCCHVL